MLTDADRELIAAAVGGDLAGQRLRDARGLVAGSPEARTLFDRLNRDAELLRSLPLAVAQRDFAVSVTSAIARAGRLPTPLPPRKLRRHSHMIVPIWGVVAAAALAFIAVTVGSFAFFSSRQPKIVAHNVATDQDNSFVAAVDQSHPIKRPPPAPSVRAPATEERPAVVAAPAATVLPETDVLPTPREVQRLTAPARPSGEGLDALTQFRLALIVELDQLARPEQRGRLLDELKRDSVARIDLFCRDPKRAADALSLALKTRGVRPLIDSSLAERLQKQVPTEFALYTESLTPEALTDFLDRLRPADTSARTFDKLVVTPVGAPDIETIGRLLGITVSSTAPRGKGTEQAALPPAPIVKGVPQPAKTAILLPYPPARPDPKTSKEVVAFLDRREHISGTVPTLIVVRLLRD